MVITIAEACRQFNVARTTMYRRIDAGVISLVEMRQGKKGVQVSDIVRVFGEPSSDAPESGLKNVPPGQMQDNMGCPPVNMVHQKYVPDNTPDNHLVHSFEARLRDKDETIADLRTRLDRASHDLSLTLRLLEDKRQPNKSSTAHPSSISQQPAQPDKLALPPTQKQSTVLAPPIIQLTTNTPSTKPLKPVKLKKGKKGKKKK